jgi:PAS domain S-box-containing protein
MRENTVHQVRIGMENEELLRTKAELKAWQARYFDLYEKTLAGYCTISEKGLILDANPVVADLLGVARSALVGQPFSRFILPEDQESFKNRCCDQRLEADAVAACELRMVNESGTVFWARLETSATQNGDGVPACRVAMARISGPVIFRKQTDEQYRFEELLIDVSAGFVNLPVGRIGDAIKNVQRLVCEALDLDLSTVWLWSTIAPRKATLAYLYRRYGGLPAPSPMPADEYFPWCRDQLEANRIVVVPSTEDLPAEAARDQETWRRFGVKSALSFPLSPAGGPPIGAMSFSVTQRKRTYPETIIKRLQLVAQMVGNVIIRRQTEAALRESEKRLSLATEAGGAGLWIMERDTEKVWVSPKTRELFHFAPDEEISSESFYKLMPPDDREKVRWAVQQAFQSGNSVHCDYRIAPTDGNIRWISARGRVVPGETGEADRLMGFALDITERKDLEARLSESQALLAMVVNSTADMVWSVDAERFGLLTFNRGLYEYFLSQRGIHIKAGMRPEDLFPAEDYVQQWRTFYGEALRDGSFTTEYQVFAGTRILRLNINRLESDHGVFGISVFGQDITASKQLEMELKRSFEEVRQLRDRLQLENIYLRDEVGSLFKNTEIVGDSKPIKDLLAQAEQVSATDSTVLILGETGTGKELLARAIHGMSMRRDRTMIVVNCASLPPTLIESELFGREKGAYTGSLTKMVGRFELADGSTLFLDEIGDMPLELQSKLLRVLEQGQFERLGSPKTIKVNVRLIAATNRDLAKDIAEGRFRKDLYYRLNVFPLTVPPLRERKTDIPSLVWSFVKQFEKTLGKHIDSIPKKNMEALMGYHWPGNIRQLKNVIEHAMILSSRRTLDIEPPAGARTEEAGSYILREMEQKHIIEVLEKTGWRISGKNGAANILGMKRTTLQSKIKALGITRSGS